VRTKEVNIFSVDSCIPELYFWFKKSSKQNSVFRINLIKSRMILMELH